MIERFARLALDCVHRPYPNQISHVLHADSDAAPPRQLTPMFYGCYDWHSAVHGHWLLVRLLRLYPEGEFAAEARAALAQSFTDENAAGELSYLAGPGRTGFERPYGLAWFLQLAAELRESRMADWSATLLPLEELIAQRFLDWLPNLAYPVRTGTHSQTAFAFTLVLDWARSAGRDDAASLVVSRACDYFARDRHGPLGYEPSGEDFLSPCLMEADLMRRVLPAGDYPDWLAAFLPDIPRDAAPDWLEPGIVTDPADGRLAHLDGLNLSRAWNLAAIAAALPASDARRPSLLAASAEHQRAGLASVTGEHYAGGHWLASFAAYLVTRRGL